MTFEELPEDVRRALLSGLAAGRRSHGGGVAPAGLDPLAQARWDGERLGNAIARLVSSDLADYAADERNYDAVASELNERYGDGVVVPASEIGPSASPGFRGTEQ